MSGPSVGATWLAGLAVVLAAGHLTWALLSPPAQPVEPARATPAAPAPGADAECRCDDLELRRELSSLRDELAALRAKSELAAMTAAAGVPNAPRAPARPKPSEKELAIALPGDRPLPKVNLFLDVPEGVRLAQREDGTLEIEALDPATKGEHFVVYVITEAGETQAVQFTVP